MAMPESEGISSYSYQKDYPYFRRLWNNVVVALLAASFLPLILIGGGMYYYASSVIKQKTIESLRMKVINHKESIDEFLAERIMDLKLLSSNVGLSALSRPDTLKRAFRSLKEGLPCFADLGIIDDRGNHLAYVGPYELISKNYKNALWFKAVMEQDVYISDVFLGFRNVPHFVIAVKRVSKDRAWVIRATIDTLYFNNIVSEVVGKGKGEAYLVNRDGVFQTTPRFAGEVMGQSEIKAQEHFEGVKLEENRKDILMTVWLKKVPWLCVVRADKDDIFTTLRQVRYTGVCVFVLGAILIVFTVLLTTNHLVSRLEAKRKSIRFLDQQLRCTSYMASSMDLAVGFFGEIKETLANIDLTAKWIQDLTMRGNIDNITESLDQIQSEVLRSRRSIDRFLRFVKPGEPIATEININEALDDLLEFLSREIHFKNIEVKRDYHDPPPCIRSDPSKVRQVFQNIILNAITAIQKEGKIIITTSIGENRATVIINDNGPGIPGENIERIFDPLFTTKPEGMGLGLPICLNIMEKLGGTISVRSNPGGGASFIVEFPFRLKQFAK